MTTLIWVLGGFLLALAAAVAVFLWIRPRSVLQDSQPRQDNPPFDTEFAVEIAPSQATPTKMPAMELPTRYGTSRMILLARDPSWLYTYWEVSATSIEDFQSAHGSEAWRLSQPVLRLYDITGIRSFNGHNANSFIDIPISETAENWHIQVNQPNRSFFADLGRVLPSGTFVTILRSNVATTPRAGFSDRLDEEWMWLDDIYRSLERFNYGVSSPLLVQELQERMGQAQLGISSRNAVPEKEDHY